MPKTKTYSYVKYDAVAVAAQEGFKAMFEELEVHLQALGAGRPQSLAATKLEEAYMWIGKAIRDEQLRRTPETPHEPARG